MACMTELGQLEEHSHDFVERKARVVVVSNDELEDAAKTQKRFPNLVVLSDPSAELIGVINAVHEHAGPLGTHTAPPTTLILDGKRIVRWIKRSDVVIARPSPK